MALNETGEGISTYYQALRRYRWLIAGMVTVTLVLSVALDASRTKVYTASAQMQLLSQNLTNYGSTVPLSPTDIATSVQVATSSEVKSIVAREIGGPPPQATAEQVGLTAVVQVSVALPQPAKAAYLANLYVNAFVSYTKTQFSQQVTSQEAVLVKERGALQNQIAVLEGELSSVKAGSSLEAVLNVQLQNASSRLQTVMSSLTELQLSLTQASSGAVVIAPAETPHKPSSPKPITDAAVFAVLGLLIGVALALGLDYFDDRIRSREHLAAAIDPIPILGEVPKFKDSDDAEYGIITFEQPHSAAAEAYRGLRTSVQFLAQDSEGARVILISSPTENDGKTTTAVNLATTIAMGGRRVILIGSDLRRPQLHNYFGLPSERGFSRVLSGELEVDDALVWLDVLPDLGIIPGGIIPPNPAELLDSERSAAVFAHLRTLADFVLIDSPPVLPVTDAVVLMRHVDAAILIAYSEQTRERELGEAIDLLTAVGGSVSGVVLNGVTYESGRYRYQYGYGYRERGYGSRTPTKDGGSLAPVGPIMDTDGDASPSSSGVLNRMVDRLRGTSDEA